METVSRTRGFRSRQLLTTNSSLQHESYTGWPARGLATWLATGLALYSLYWVIGIVHRSSIARDFLLIVLVLSFLFYRGPAARAPAARPSARLADSSRSQSVSGVVSRQVDFARQPLIRAADAERRRVADARRRITHPPLVLEATAAHRRCVLLRSAATCFILARPLQAHPRPRGPLGMIAHRLAAISFAHHRDGLPWRSRGWFGVPLDAGGELRRPVSRSLWCGCSGASGARKSFFLDFRSMAAVGRVRRRRGAPAAR